MKTGITFDADQHQRPEPRQLPELTSFDECNAAPANGLLRTTFMTSDKRAAMHARRGRRTRRNPR